MGTLQPSTSPQAGPNQKQGLFRSGIKEHMHAPKAAKPMGAGDHFPGCHGDATEGSIPEKEGGMSQSPPTKPMTPWGRGPVKR
jgi:hypothetical protein